MFNNLVAMVIKLCSTLAVGARELQRDDTEQDARQHDDEGDEDDEATSRGDIRGAWKQKSERLIQ